jgi:phosphopantothenoylcysteine decarboxylase/phosphopantothenate--cysteine ligase
MADRMDALAKVVDGRRLLIGLSGGIACYKTATVVSRLTQAGAETTVLMTEAATRFVTPLTFQALSGRPVYTNQWSHVESQDPQHISLARSAEAMLIAPCSMDLLAKLAMGRTDDVVSLIVSAMDRSTQPVLLAPSMNAVMYRQPATQRNLGQLEADGFTLIDPSSGWQACRTEGVGRLPEPEALIDAVCDAVSSRVRPPGTV